MMKQILGIVLAAVSLNGVAFAAKPLALVWNGPGVCPIGCAKAAQIVARQSGFRTLYINPSNMDQTPFHEARVWVQPGGKSSTAAKAMGPAMLDKIKKFVKDGGGYVGYCAGMFMSTEEIASRGVAGVGIIPGRTELYLQDDPPMTIMKVKIGERTRRVYYAGGPMLHLSDSEAAANGVKILSRYENGAIAALYAPYGAGHVAVAGFHPEAGLMWTLARFKLDLDGTDRWFARQMMKMATP
jgi:glutamine amidotransferase-like uncharacterized protein